MCKIRCYVSYVIVAVAALAGTTDTLGGERGEAKFHQAYYAEQADRDFRAAADLYAEVVRDRKVGAELRIAAEVRLAAVREDLAVGDFARLMPSDALAYLEITQPGEQLMKLLGQLGLLSDGGLPPADGGRRVAVSPALIRESLGIRGAAVAVTGFDPRQGAPSGVAVFHHGNVEVIRALIETALPIGAKLVEPVGGFPTYDVEGEALVTLTPRLVIASRERSQINDVVRRLRGDEQTSLATTETVAAYTKERGDSLCFFMVNAAPIMPILKGMMAANAGAHELAMADALLDLDNLQSLVGQIRVDDEGVGLELALRLDEGHRSLVFNFLRTPAIDQGMLQCVPDGAAAFVVGALNEAPSRFGGGGVDAAEGAPVVTALDIGREFFGNINSFALYGAALEDGAGRQGPPIPDVGLVFRVNDPSKSEALWTQMLGIASLAAGAGAIEGDSATIDGVKVRSFGFPDGITVYVGTEGQDVLIAGSRSAMARSITAKRGGRSVLDDASFTEALGGLSAGSTKGVFVHAGRCVRIARPFMSGPDAAEMDRFMDKLSDTVFSLAVEHSDRVFRISARLNGLPEVGDVIAELIEADAQRGEMRRLVARAKRNGDWDQVTTAVDAAMAANPRDGKLLRSKFDALAIGKKDHAAAVAVADSMFEAGRDDPNALNNFAWALLTEEQFGGGYHDVALRFAQRCNKITAMRNWMFVDTLALAKFETGDVAGAIETEKKAIELSGGTRIEELKAALARFENAADRTLAESAP